MKDIRAFYNVMASTSPKWIDNDTFAFVGTQSGRSEEHTSELQSHSESEYAVF